MSGQLSLPVLFDHITYFIHALDHKHLNISQVIFMTVSIFVQQPVVSAVKRVNGVKKTCQMIVKAASPHKSISVGIGFYLGSIYVKNFQRDQTFFF